MVGVGGEVLFSTATRVYDGKLRLKRGLHKLSVWPVECAPVPQLHSGGLRDAGVSDEYFRLLKLKERYGVGWENRGCGGINLGSSR